MGARALRKLLRLLADRNHTGDGYNVAELVGRKTHHLLNLQAATPPVGGPNALSTKK